MYTFMHTCTIWKKSLNLYKGEEINEKELKWEQRVAKKYWDKLFTEYAICDLTYFKSKFFFQKIQTK